MRSPLTRLQPRNLYQSGAKLLPGLAISALIAIAATFLSEHYGGPIMLFALLIGMAFHFLSEESRFARGLDIAAKTILRLGVALLGLRITVDQLIGLGWFAPVAIVISVVATILFGMAIARLFGLKVRFGVLTGGAVAICGASAALAIASVLPKSENAERDTIFAVIGVTALSTLAMILYPIVFRELGLNDHQMGFILGGTIHDVAQVVGAGYSVSAEAGDLATVTKLMRVALLVPVVAALALLFATQHDGGTRRGLVLPWFLIAFVILAGANSAALVPAAVVEFFNQVSRWCLVIAISALGVKTSLQALGKLGWRPVMLMVAETAFIAVVVLVFVLVF